MELLLLVFLLLAAMSAAVESITSTAVKTGCQERCGGVDIPYPFGIGPGCSRHGFELSCVSNGSGAGPIAVLAGTSIQVTRLSVEPAESQVMLPVGWQCYNTSQPTRTYPDWSRAKTEMNRGGVYRISNTHNMLVVLGCNTVGYTESLRSEGGAYSSTYYIGCMSYCNNSASAQDGQCAGVGCCHVDIPPGLTDSSVNFRVYDHTGMVDYSPCDYAFLTDRTNYSFRRADLIKMDKNRNVPVWLDWAIRENGSMSCAEAKGKPGYACVSVHSECVDSTNGPGYNCKCTAGYEGNAYAPDGCTNINECDRPSDYPCHGICQDTDGSYDCKCHRGYQNSGDPKEQPCSPKFPLAAQIALGITLGISFLIVGLLFILMMRQKRRMNEYFRKNGGSVLQKVENIKIFTKDELKKITKNNSEVLGQGGFGKVYKGILEDNTLVAVKASIEVNDARKEDFTNEVIIQSQMIHTNIIKLLGCCLEVDVPMLVYEFAANGNLQDILHGDNNRRVPLPLDLRMDIAVEAAEGLRYMHSSANRTIRHGDVKPANILLNDKFKPKISDFGTSKLLTVDKDFTMFVVGSMGYIDPVFHKTGRLTQKSDVYSFGVVLLELITRKPTIYDANCSLLIDFQKAYEQENSGRAMFDKDFTIEEEIFILEEIGRLAMECLKEKVEERPDMKEVAEQLVILRRSRKSRQGNYNISPQQFEEMSTEGTPLSLETAVSVSSSVLSAPSTPANNDFSNA
ncbi:wall-associated receptor kinase 2 [Oryza sativa Japonica Group]|uniref:wall-associated receptor kinase 2 n=1 Tax=Oryza sativa subsp. japonica TaxID=39947 RepID=UPI000E1C3BEB|nr:wall-associated receptor kinase 2 [Oryza sativa Japonica Group]